MLLSITTEHTLLKEDKEEVAQFAYTEDALAFLEGHMYRAAARNISFERIGDKALRIGNYIYRINILGEK
jgi:hypothetical protein